MDSINGYGSINHGVRQITEDEGSLIFPTSKESSTVSSKKFRNGAVIVVVSMFLLAAAKWQHNTVISGSDLNYHLITGEALRSSPAAWRKPGGDGVVDDWQINTKPHNPKDELYFDQVVDHNNPKTSGTYKQRYYENLDYFEGPGHPIFVIIGGEDELKQILYPYISEILAEKHGAYTICPEHRYFGKSNPVAEPTNDDLRDQLTIRQALQDTVRLIQSKQEQFGCGPRGSAEYCPVMTVGGSYPGILSALMRIAYPDIVDIGYASSAPLHVWDHSLSQGVYYEYITKVADQESPGCAKAVKDTLLHVQNELTTMETTNDLKSIATEYGICLDDDTTTGEELAQDISEKVVARFRDSNMDYYPPGPELEFFKLCMLFQDEEKTEKEKINEFMKMAAIANDEEFPPKCLADDYNTSGDSSSNDDDNWDDVSVDVSWNILCCRLLPKIGISSKSMFLADDWSMESDMKDCKDNYGIVIENPNALIDEFGFNDLSNQSNILFTNGANDGWAPLSYLSDINDSVVSLYFPNGAHHSELTHELQEHDTPDIKQGHKDIADIVGKWLEESKKVEQIE